MCIRRGRPRSLACAMLACLASLMQSAVASDNSDLQRTDAANEPTQIGAPADRDAAAEQEALTGWYAQALKTRDQRLQWWREARFGCFIHWGPYSVLGGRWRDEPNPGYAEHIMRVNRIPLAVYRDEVAAHFRPDRFNARDWVRLIKAAGMRYVIITAKHHDGFALWPSQASRYNIRDVAHFDRDPLRELVDAARADGLRVGFYYSHAFDWQDPDAPGNDWDYDNPGGDKQLHGGRDWWNEDREFLTRTDHYIRTKAIPQLQELIARYHPDILWFDTPGKLPFYQQAQIVEAVRKADPTVVINGRAARNGSLNLGDYLDTADRPAELRPTAGDWEAIPTTNESYGWNALDHRHKPVDYFIRLIAKAAAKGGNTLLNIGPRGDGLIDPADTAILDGIARWMQVNGESIHATQRTPLDRQPWGDSTVNGDRLYLHVFQWPANRQLVVGGLQSKVRKIHLLTREHRPALPFHWTPDHDLAIQVPSAAPDVVDTVIVVETQGGVKGIPGRLVDPTTSSNRLLAFDAEAHGTGFSYGDGKASRYYLDGLERGGNALQWMIRGVGPGEVRLQVRYAAVASGGSASTAAPDSAEEFVVEYAGQKRHGRVEPATGAAEIRTADLGTVALRPGKLLPLTLTLGNASTPDGGSTLNSSRSTVHVFEVTLAGMGAAEGTGAGASACAARGAAVVKALRHGGYVLVIRHASSPSAPPDKTNADPENTGMERQLDDSGRRAATSMGQAIRRLHIPLGTVLSSPAYRALQTVRFAGLGTAKAVAELDAGGQNMMHAAAAEDRSRWLHRQVAIRPPAGANTVIVTHAPNIIGAFGDATADIADGETLVFRPDGKGNAVLVARIKIAAWAGLEDCR